MTTAIFSPCVYLVLVMLFPISKRQNHIQFWGDQVNQENARLLEVCSDIMRSSIQNALYGTEPNSKLLPLLPTE